MAHTLPVLSVESRNSIGSQLCQIDSSHGSASVDAKTKIGPWGYLCMDCAESYAVRNRDLITNITDEPLEIGWL